MKSYVKIMVCTFILAALHCQLSSAQLSERAPDVLPGVVKEMYDSSYWIARMKSPDKIIFSTQEIFRRNERYKKRISKQDFFETIPEAKKVKLHHYFPGIELRLPDLSRLSAKDIADSVKRRIEIKNQYLRKQDYGSSTDVKYADWEIDELENEMNLDNVGDRLEIRNAIAVRSTRLKNVPAFAPEKIGLVKNKARSRFDIWSIGVVKIGKKVTVLHPSLSGEFVFVQCEIGYGWVRSEDVAFATDSEIAEFTEANDFIICTDDRIQFYSDSDCVYSSGWLRMGDRIPLVSAANSRLIQVPVRRTNGQFATEIGWLAEDADVSIGYLPYTRRNVVTTAFKLLGNAYDFTGTFFGRQHETTYRDIFSCFGFDLPFHGGMFTYYGDDETVLDPEVGRDAQYEKILTFDPFVTIMITLQDTGGHCQLLLGGENGVPIVFDQHGYSYTDDEGTELIIRRCTVDDITLPAYFLKRKLSFLPLK